MHFLLMNPPATIGNVRDQGSLYVGNRQNSSMDLYASPPSSWEYPVPLESRADLIAQLGVIFALPTNTIHPKMAINIIKPVYSVRNSAVKEFLQH